MKHIGNHMFHPNRAIVARNTRQFNNMQHLDNDSSRYESVLSKHDDMVPKADKVTSQIYKGVPVRFDKGQSITTIYGTFNDVYLYTERYNIPIVNYCDRCNNEYYSVTNLYTASAIKQELKLCKCPHSVDISVYIKHMSF